AHIDSDYKRYGKRLKREGEQLLTFLKHKGVPYHNNTSERALRLFALARKVCYSSRSRRGIKTSEILTTIYSTCMIRGVNPYTFMKDYLDGKTDTIPLQQNCMTSVCASTYKNHPLLQAGIMCGPDFLHWDGRFC
ncbi:MAG: transposase, partial [Cenarchaeum sp. SB0678_bin_8]|nr:transposase [Cenarchaeum sp. SB0678_bin_8]